MLKPIISAVIIAVFLFFTSAYIALKMGALPWPIIFSIIVSSGLLKIFGGLSTNKVNIAQAGGSIGGLMAAAAVQEHSLFAGSKALRIATEGLVPVYKNQHAIRLCGFVPRWS